MRILLILLSGVFLGVIFTIVINTFYFSYEENKNFIKNIYDDDDNEDVDDHELNRVVIFNNKMSIKMDEEDILLSGIKFNSFENKINSYNVSIRALSVSNVSFIEMVNEYDLLEVQLQSKNEELNFIKSKFDRLNELYKAQGSVALKDIEKVKHDIDSINFSITEIKLKIKNLLNNIKLKFGDLIVKDITTNRKLFNSLMNKNASLILLEDSKIDNSYLIDDIGLTLKDIEKVKHDIDSINFSITEIKLKIKNLLNNIKLKFGDLIVKDITTNRKLFNSLMNKNASLILLEDSKIDNSYLIDDIGLTFLTYSIDKKSLLGDVGLYYLENKYYTPDQKLIAYSPSESGVPGFLMPESALVYFQGQMWMYIYDEIESLFTRDAVNKILYKNDNKVFIPSEMSKANIVIEGGQILLAEEFKSQIMREDDD